MKCQGAYYNDENLRLIGISKKNKKLVLEVQPVEYQWYVHTNLVLDAKIGKSVTLREFLHAHGKLGESPLANNLGINILVFTADGSLIIKKRKKVAFRMGELDPSASGTLCLTDLLTSMTLDKYPILEKHWKNLALHQAA